MAIDNVTATILPSMEAVTQIADDQIQCHMYMSSCFNDSFINKNTTVMYV